MPHEAYRRAAGRHEIHEVCDDFRHHNGLTIHLVEQELQKRLKTSPIPRTKGQGRISSHLFAGDGTPCCRWWCLRVVSSKYFALLQFCKIT